MAENIISNILKGLKGLSDCESRSLIELMKRQKLMDKAEIVKILNDKDICEGNSAYKIIASLLRKNVLFERDLKYETINSNMLITECSNGVTKLETEIQGLEITSDWKKSDPRKKARIIDQEFKIINELFNMKSKYSFEFFYKPNDQEMGFWNDLKENNFKEKPVRGLYNCIAFQSKDKPTSDSGVIILSKTTTKQGKQIFYGNLIFDDELKKALSKKKGEKDE